ncbi:MAG TPA: hypothetical protein VFN21_07495 [Acidimicrobiales bacterium]|nr:hypothetical protein [Acidimicrobiales bacterium]
MTIPFSAGPFDDPPPLGDDIEERTRRRARSRLARRRVTAVGLGAGVVALALVAVLSLRSDDRRPDTLRTIDRASETTTGPTRSATTNPSTPGAPDETGTADNSTAKPSTNSSTSPRTTSATRRPVGPSTPAGTTGSGAQAGAGSPGAPPGTSPAASGPPSTHWPLDCPTGGNVAVVVTLHSRPGTSAGTWEVGGSATITNTSGGAIATLGWVYPSGATVVGTGGPLTIGWEGNGTAPAPDGGDNWIHVPPHTSVTVDLQAVGSATVQSGQAPTSFTVGGRYVSWFHPLDSCPGLTMSVTGG